MPKDKSTNKNDDNQRAEAVNASTPAAVFSPPTQPNASDATSFTPADNAGAPVTNLPTRRLGTGAIIGISAAGFALLAGVFGGGVALGNATSHHGGFDQRGHMEQADSRMPDGQFQGGQMQGGPGNDGDFDGPMSAQMPHQRDARGNNFAPGAPGAPGMGSGPATSAPVPTN